MAPSDESAALTRHGLEQWREPILAAARDSLRLFPAAGRAPLVRLGGMPRLRAGTSWPRSETGPLAFVAEIDLAAVARVFPNDLLPTEGYLEFFYEDTQDAFGLDAADRENFRVIWTGNRGATIDPPDDLVATSRYKPVDLTGERQTTLPWVTAWEVEKLALDPGAQVRYAEALDDLERSRRTPIAHRLFGHADPVQGDVMQECELGSNGINYRDPAAVADAAPRAAAWRLILQVDSDQRGAGMMWGDAGRLYFCMREPDLREGAWDRAWMILQC